MNQKDKKDVLAKVIVGSLATVLIGGIVGVWAPWRGRIITASQWNNRKVTR